MARTQKCNCPSIIKEAAAIIKENYIGYWYIKDKNAYTNLLNKLLNKAKRTSQDDCYMLAGELVAFFRDNHISYEHQLDLKTYKKVYSKIAANDTGLKQYVENTKDKTEGLWLAENNMELLFAQRMRLGVYNFYVVKEKFDSWERGYLKYSIYQRKDNEIYCCNYQPSAKSYRQQFSIGSLSDSIFKESGIFSNRKVPWNYFKKFDDLEFIYPRTKFKFSLLDSNTCLLQFPSFAGKAEKIIDSMVKTNDNILRSKKNLIIDVRGNFGGNSDSYQPLVKYVYDENFKVTNAYDLATEKSIKLIDDYLKDSGITKREIIEYTLLVKKMKAGINKPVYDNSPYEYPKEILKYPASIAVLFNNKTASAAELFIQVASTSKKVKLFGINSSGAVDFGWAIKNTFKCNNYRLDLPVQMNSNTLIMRSDIKGISPDVLLAGKEETWYDQILNNSFFY
jgi:hypothetical protein